MDKLRVTAEAAPKIREWIKTRGGVLVWNSINLSNPGATWFTPALDDKGAPYGKPNWQCDSKPERHVTAEADVEVAVLKEVKRFHIAIEQGSGLTYTLTSGSSNRLRNALTKAGIEYGSDATFRFDYETQEAIILVPEAVVPMPEWKG